MVRRRSALDSTDGAADDDETTLWYAFYSQKHQREYYYEPKSKRTTWIVPDDVGNADDDGGEDMISLTRNVRSKAEPDGILPQTGLSSMLKLVPSSQGGFVMLAFALMLLLVYFSGTTRPDLAGRWRWMRRPSAMAVTPSRTPVVTKVAESIKDVKVKALDAVQSVPRPQLPRPPRATPESADAEQPSMAKAGVVIDAVRDWGDGLVFTRTPSPSSKLPPTIKPKTDSGGIPKIAQDVKSGVQDQLADVKKRFQKCRLPFAKLLHAECRAQPAPFDAEVFANSLV